jgi:hypothetical protein
MRKIIVLTLIAFAVSAVIIAQPGPAYAGQTTPGVNAVDTVVGTQTPVPFQLVRGMHGGRGGHMAFSRGSVGSFRAARFNNFRFHNARFNHFRNFRHFRPFVFGSVVPYSSSYFYNSYNDNCIWDGYVWRCYDTTY